jgi:hypothetical protein
MDDEAKSREAQNVLNSLSKKEIKQIQKTNPNKDERNTKIRELLKRGVKINIISEISGIHRSHIRTIKNYGFKKGYGWL